MPLTKNEKLLLGLLVLAAVVVRTCFAWIGQWSTDPDRGVASLMALHMAEGRAWPIFFYGQAYMGSLEPWVASLVCRLFGVSGFTVCLGTALPAALLVIPVYLLTRRIAGTAAGVVAASFLVLGPDAFVAYMSSPRGGYAAILLVNTLILLLAARIADGLWQKKPLMWSEGCWLGLCAGLGWWTGPMVLPALGIAGLLLLVALRGRIFQRVVFQATLFFFVGSLPWWWWNAEHGWISLSMRKSVGGVGFFDAWGLLALRTWRLLGWSGAHGSATLLLVLLGGIFLLVAGLALRAAWRERRMEAVWALAAVMGYGLLFGCAYSVASFSRVETQRYVLPLLPALVVLLGVGGGLLARVHRALLGLCFAVAIVPPIYVQWALPPEGMKEKKSVLAAPRFAEQLREMGIDVVFADYPWHWVNFATRGAATVVEPAGDAVPLIDRAGLLARNPAFLPSDSMGPFFQRTRSRYQQVRSALGRLFYDVRPACDAWRVLPVGGVVSMQDANGTALDRLMDFNLGTGWTGESVRDQRPPSVQLNFREPTTIAGVLLFSWDDRYPMYMVLEGRAELDAPWQVLTAECHAEGWYWSGPQAYYRDLYYSVELRCPPTRVLQIRLSLPPSSRRPIYEFSISEVSVLESTGAEYAFTQPDVDALLEVSRARGVHQLYAHRWLSDRVAARAWPDLEVAHSARLSRGNSDERCSLPSLFSDITTLTRSAVFSESGAVDHNRTLLESMGCTLERIPLTGGELLVVTAPPDGHPPLTWTGTLLMKAPGSSLDF